MSRRPYIAHRAPALTDTPRETSQARPWIAPQGRPAWIARRCSPEMARELVQAQFHSPDCGFPFEAASACTEIGAEAEPRRKLPLSPAEAYLLMVIYVLSCCIAVWALCLIADALTAAAR